jgi:hypothetical protein
VRRQASQSAPASIVPPSQGRHAGDSHRPHQAARGSRRHRREHARRAQHRGIAAGTFKNRMSALRWLAEKIGEQNIVTRENAGDGIDR